MSLLFIVYIGNINVLMGAWVVQSNVLKLGQWGGYGGKAWEWNGPIRKISLRHGAVVDSLIFTNTKDGKTETSPKFGGDRGERSSVRMKYATYFLMPLMIYPYR